MITLKALKEPFASAEESKTMKVTVEGSYVVDYKDWNGQIQLIRGDEETFHSSNDLVTVHELLEVFAGEEFENLPIADEDGKEFDVAAATKTKLNFKYVE